MMPGKDSGQSRGGGGGAGRRRRRRVPSSEGRASAANASVASADSHEAQVHLARTAQRAPSLSLPGGEESKTEIAGGYGFEDDGDDYDYRFAPATGDAGGSAAAATTTTTTASAAAAQDHFGGDEDADLALARRLQEEMEEMEEQERLERERARRIREEDDAALARRLMEQGSFRGLGIGQTLSELPEEGPAASSSSSEDRSLELARRLEQEQGRGQGADRMGSSDEALARQLFEESLMNLTGGEDLSTLAASDRRGGIERESSASNLPALPGETDEELARRYLKNSMRSLVAGGGGGGGGAGSDAALARRLQAQHLEEGRAAAAAAASASSSSSITTAPSSTTPPTQTRSGRARDLNSASMQQEDELLARRLMQEGLQELHAGQVTAIRAAQNSGGASASSSAHGADDYERMARLRQEQEDELLALQFAQEAGGQVGIPVRTPATRPGAQAVHMPATLAPQAAVARVHGGNNPRSPRGSTAAATVPAHRQREATPSDQSAGPRPSHDQSPGPLNSGGERNPRAKRGSFLNRLTGRGRQGGAEGNTPLPIPPPPEPPQRMASSRPGPFPHSVSVSQLLPARGGRGAAGAGPNMNIPEAAAVPSTNGRVPNKRASESSPICFVCHKPAPSYLSTLDKKYHPECFKCMGCHAPIDHTIPFAYTIGEDGEKHPLHRQCYAELFGIKCAVCLRSIPTGADGKVSYVKHPFFDKERMCPRHAQNPGRRCTGCHRFEPEGDGFADLGDAGRCVCMSCCRSVIVDSSDAKPLWDVVVHFFEDILGLPLWGTMRETPVLVVGYDALNDQLQSSGGAHSGSSQIMTRGLCLSEHQSGDRIPVQRMHYNNESGKFLPADVEDKGFTFFQVPDPSKTNPNSSVTAILCLSGLPSDLTASILAHEATHAWFKLHPNFDVRRPIPLRVEEGCCQLMAYLFLQYLDTQKSAEDGSGTAARKSSGANDGPTDEKLRQYFKFSIETDESEAYGVGYREAAQAYAAIGIEALMSHIVLYRAFPDV